MRAPAQIVHDRCLLADVRLLLSLEPALACNPERLTEVLNANEHEVLAALEALLVEGEVLV